MLHPPSVMLSCMCWLPRRGVVDKSCLTGGYLALWVPLYDFLVPGFFLCRPVSRCKSCKKPNTPSFDSQLERRWDARPVPKNTPRNQAGTCPRGTGSLRLNPARSCQQKHVLSVTGMGIALCDQRGINPSHQQAGLGKGCQHCPRHPPCWESLACCLWGLLT